MRKLFMVAGAVAALATYSNSAMAAHTNAEIHMFFGSGIVDGSGAVPAAPTASELTTNPDVAVAAGHFVDFPIWLRLLPGDFPAGQLTSIGFRVFASGPIASVSNLNNTNNFVWNPGAQAVPAATGNGLPNLTVDSTGTLRQFRSGYFNIKSATDANLNQGTYFLGTMRVNVLPTALPTDVIQFFLAASGDVAGQDTVSTGTATNATIAFGANGSGGLDTFRRGNTNLDIQGANQTSTIADATVSVVPEPTTLGLLAIGVAGLIRRRRNA